MHKPYSYSGHKTFSDQQLGIPDFHCGIQLQALAGTCRHLQADCSWTDTGHKGLMPGVSNPGPDLSLRIFESRTADENRIERPVISYSYGRA